MQDPSAEPAGPSKHLWLGNLHPRLTRTALRAAFEVFGELEDVVTFPGRMYAFVNFCGIQDAIHAVQLMHGRPVRPKLPARSCTSSHWLHGFPPEAHMQAIHTRAGRSQCPVQ